MVCCIFPIGVALRELLTAPSWDAAVLGSRQVQLLLRGLGVALLVGLLAQPLGAALASGMLGRSTAWARAVAAAAAFVILTPPYVYAYAWSLTLLPEGLATATGGWLPQWLTTTGRAVLCLASWTAPLAAIVLALGWRAVGVHVWRLALLDASPGRAALAAAGAMGGWLGLSIALVVVVAQTEYSVCHLCLVQTWNTEILAEVQLLARPGAGLLMSWPLLALLAVAAGVGLVFARRALAHAAADDVDASFHGLPAGRLAWRAAPALLTLGLLLAPWAMLGASLRQPAALLESWATYRAAWPTGLLIAGTSAAISLLMGLGAAMLLAGRCGPGVRVQRWAGGCVLLAAAVTALLPPAVIGDACAAAFIGVPWIYDSWLIVSIVTAARYALIVVALLCWSMARAAPWCDLSLVDGAAPGQALVTVAWPMLRPAAAAGGVVVAALSLTEVAATQLVASPGVRNLALTLLNQIHFGRDAQIIAQIIWLGGLLLALAVLLPWVYLATVDKLGGGAPRRYSSG